jgi:hypothetical protein
MVALFGQGKPDPESGSNPGMVDDFDFSPVLGDDLVGNG